MYCTQRFGLQKDDELLITEKMDLCLTVQVDVSLYKTVVSVYLLLKDFYERTNKELSFMAKIVP